MEGRFFMTDTSGTRPLPPNPSLERLRKEAKQRLKVMRPACEDVTLSEAQFQLARSYGFSSWRSLKAAVERRQGMVDQPRSGMAAFLTRPQAARRWVPDAGRAEEAFAPLSALSMLVLQPLVPFALHLFR
jgi:hypothetical protein